MKIHSAFIFVSMVVTRSNSGDKATAILRAAVKVFAQNGYFNSKVSDIAKSANVADGTVYLYFKSKEDILHSVFDRTMSEAIVEAREKLAKIEDPRERLKALAEMHLQRLGTD